jgi:SAM-dependent methyltransferase
VDTERWSAALWPFVHSRLPAAPATVIEIGCGPAGGFVPALRASGYDATGIDPNAPEAEGYHRLAFEGYAPPRLADAILASRSLHHVGDVGEILARAAGALVPSGVIVVAEWVWEQFDEDTARWCFARLGEPGADERDWLRRRRDGWRASGLGWDAYFIDWAAQHGLHRGEQVLRELDARFEPVVCTRGPYFFADLGAISEREEQAAIDAGEIRATGLRYAGRLGPVS